jgi:SAM-dependent methyltransferase
LINVLVYHTMALLGEPGTPDVAASYDAIATHYDAFTEHPNYPNWVRSVEALARRHGLTGRRALDLACGTGSSLHPLVELGYDAVGCDVSAGMLEQAACKLPGNVPLVVADMRSLPALGSFDLVWALNDGVNYLADGADLLRAFTEVARCLEPDGIFVFDVNTLLMYATFFATTQVRETDTLFMAWLGSDDERPGPGQALETRLEIFELDASGAWRRATSHQHQRHHPQAEIRSALDSAGLRTLAVHGLTDGAVIEEHLDERRHGKAIFVATPEHRERR